MKFSYFIQLPGNIDFRINLKSLNFFLSIINLMFSQSISGVLDELIKALGLASIVYPLERIQSIKQIQSTYSDSSVREHKSIITRSIHNGVKSYFRGYMPFITKMGILNLSAKFTEFGLKDRSEYQNGIKYLNFGFSTLAYFLTYPLEIVNIRMSAQIERERFYINTRQCMSKIKKSQGIKTLYRGFFWGFSIFALQFSFLQELQSTYQGYFKDMSEWQKIGATFGAIGLSEILLYPLISLKKIYQINGAMGHVDQNFSIRVGFKRSKLTTLWQGFEIRLINIFIYSLLYFLSFDEKKAQAN